MLGALLIVFRETLEAALFVGLVAAATRGVSGRSRWLSGGVLAGVAGALVLAGMAEQIGAWANGVGQDLVTVGILLLAWVMLAWHCVWVPVHAREAAREARALGQAVSAGDAALWTLATVVALAVLREGAETVLFISGYVTAAGGDAGSQGVLLGGVAGLVAGVLAGALLYFGLSRIPPQRMFAVTNVLMLLFAASIASQLAQAINQLGWIELWGEPLWDTSAWLATDSSLGAVLHALVGYDAQPTGMQLAFYAGALLLLMAATRWAQRRTHPTPAGAAVA